MKEYLVKIYQCKPSELLDQNTLIRSLTISVLSEKRLNASGAAKLIKRELPEYVCGDIVNVVETKNGWMASRSIDKHRWEYAVIMK